MKNLKLTRKIVSVMFFILLIVVLAGCADVTPIDDCVVDKPAGFLWGLWHGIIAPVSFIGSLFIDDIAMYAVNNTGGWYDFGFVIGAGILFGGSGKATKK